MGGGCLSPRAGDLDQRVRQGISQQLPDCFMMGDDRLAPVGKQRVIRVQMDGCYNQIIVPGFCSGQEFGRGPVIHIHDIHSISFIPVRCTDFRSAVDCIQYKDVHKKRSEVAERGIRVLDHQICKQGIAPDGVGIHEGDALAVQGKCAFLGSFGKANLSGNVFLDMDTLCKEERDNDKDIDLFLPEFIRASP